MKTCLFRLLLMLVFLNACASTQGNRISLPPATSLSEARQSYLAGLEALHHADYPAAKELFLCVTRAPAYVIYVPLAKLRLADAAYFQERFEEAIEGYRSFIETNPIDPNIHYATFMLAKSAYKAQPADFFLDPPADRRDQRRIRSSLVALTDFIERFPNSPYIDEALTMHKDSVVKTVSFEMEVARFYMTRKKPLGAIQRLQRLLREIPRAKAYEKVHLALAEALIANSAYDEVRILCQQYTDRFPLGNHQKKMNRICEKAPAEIPLLQQSQDGR